MRDYERRFQEVNGELARLQAAIDDLSACLAQQVKAQTASLQAAVDDIRSLLVGQDSAQSASLKAGMDGLHARLAEQDSAHKEGVESARQQLQQAQENLRDELHATAQQLAFTKTDRTSLGDLLIQLGKQLQADGSTKAQ
jgi:hypothetical protein